MSAKGHYFPKQLTMLQSHLSTERFSWFFSPVELMLHPGKAQFSSTSCCTAALRK